MQDCLSAPQNLRFGPRPGAPKAAEFFFGSGLKSENGFHFRQPNAKRIWHLAGNFGPFYLS
jgi:hypothetical protein